MLLFSDKMDGLHIWEAGIIMARFVALNPQLFEGKTVLELGSGVGIVGLSCLKFTKAY